MVQEIGPGPAPALTLRWGADALSCPPALARLRMGDTPLSRVPPLAILGTSIPQPTQGGLVVLAASDFVLSGRVWTAFRRGSTIVKVHVPAPGDMGHLEEAAIEGWVYEHRLAGLAVPRWKGMYAGARGKGPARIVAAALEDAGEPMSAEEVAALTPAERYVTETGDQARQAPLTPAGSSSASTRGCTLRAWCTALRSASTGCGLRAHLSTPSRSSTLGRRACSTRRTCLPS